MRTVLIALVVLLACGSLFAQAPDSGDSVLEALSEKADRLDVLWEAGSYEAAVGLLHEMKRDALSARRQDLAAAVTYTLACGYSLLDDRPAALVQLSSAVDLGFSDFVLMRWDPDLDNVRRLPEFEWILQQAKEAHRIDWNDAPAAPVTVLADDPACEQLRRLRREHDLDAVVAGCETDRERLHRIVRWARSSFTHHGSNEPSASDPLTILSEAAEGASFRCVEYAALVVSAARALGMPARELCLATRDVETRPSGAGHVVAEVWLADLGVWAFADGQKGIVPERDGVPLSAVGFREAIWDEDPNLSCEGGEDVRCADYRSWVLPHLYYFLVRADQRFYVDSPEGARDLMLLPEGARRPGVFQRTSRPYENTRFTSNPAALYAPPVGERPADERGSAGRAATAGSSEPQARRSE